MHKNATRLIIPIILLLLSSCVTRKTVPYFADFSDTSKPTTVKTIAFTNPLIQPEDILFITFSTLDNSLVAPINTTNSTDAGTQAQGQGINGYMVDENGTVELPFLGTIKVSNLTTKQAQDTIKAAANKLFNNPIVNVRYANLKITVLGEVARPGVYTMPSEKITLFDALGTAGDLTPFGKSNSILLVRDSTGDNRQMVRLDINSKNIISSPYYFLKPNDMLYVEPTEDKLQSTQDVSLTRQRITIITSSLAAISAVILILSRL